MFFGAAASAVMAVSHAHESANMPLYNGLGFPCYSLGESANSLTLQLQKWPATPSHKNMAFKTLHHHLAIAPAE